MRTAARRLGGRVVTYKASELDFLAVYILPEDGWFIVPAKEIVGAPACCCVRSGMRGEIPMGITGRPGICCGKRVGL
jgi:hypothetical protein